MLHTLWSDCSDRIADGENEMSFGFRKHVVLFLFFLAASGCGKARDTSCTVEKTGDTTIMTCPDGTSATFTETNQEYCSVTDNGDGTKTIECTDGTNLVIPDEDDGGRVLVRLVEEPPGENCPRGGTVVESGMDADGDGVLDDDEVAGISYVCDGTIGGSGVLEGSAVIRNALDVAILSGYTEITEDLVIAAPGLSDFDLPALSRVGGNLEILDNDVLGNLDGLSNIEDVGGDLWIDGNPAMTDLLGLSNLTSIPGKLMVTDNDSLDHIDGLSGISTVSGWLFVIGNRALLDVEGLSNLIRVDGDLVVESNFSLENLEGLSALTFVGGKLWFAGNYVLESLGLDSLGRVDGSFWIWLNPDLPTCEAERLRDQVLEADGIGGGVVITDNDDTGTCD